AWSRENSDIGLASQLASSLQPLWLVRGRIREGLTWFDAALSDQNAHPGDIAPAVRARALADKATLNAYAGATDSLEQACEALSIAREVDDPALLARALTACGGIAVYNPEVARPYFAEASGLARSIGDKWRLSQILFWQAFGAFMAGDPIAVRAAAEDGGNLDCLRGPGCAGARGSDRRPTLGRRRRRDDDRLAPVAAADHACACC